MPSRKKTSTPLRVKRGRQGFLGTYPAKRTCKNLSDTDAATLAGLVAGEGTMRFQTNLKWRENVFVPQITIGNTDPQMLEWLVETTGLGSAKMKYTTTGSYSKRKIGQWNSYGWENCKYIVRRILPYLPCKKMQGLLFYAALQVHRPGHKASDFEQACNWAMWDLRTKGNEGKKRSQFLGAYENARQEFLQD